MDLSNIRSALIVHSSAQTSDIKSGPVYDILKSSAKLNEINVDSLSSINENYDSIFTIEQDFNTAHFTQFLKILNPGGYLLIKKSNSVNNLNFVLKINGFLVKDDKQDAIVAQKPEYEVGSAVKIDLIGEKSQKIWSLGDDDIKEDDLINDEELLDEQDKIKPSAEELRVCATTKQRKACANCSCGLKEELEQEEIGKIRENSQNAKSSCGNCYLGDAFRCSSCPYRGLPAFKPGEKIVIDNTDDL